MNTKDLLFLGLAATGVYLVYKFVNKAGDTLTATGEDIGSTLFDWLNPDPTGEMLFYTVTFPDGSRHAIPSRSVVNGIFQNTGNGVNYTGDGQMYQIKNDAAGNHYAILM